MHVGFRNRVTTATSGLTTITACSGTQYIPSPGAACASCPVNTICNLIPCAPGTS